ncbi:MAG TPA: hypothetical protein VK203_07845 [Nostocaceae cyanobacterium]|nr:hypothetical protein [Nostocaceae cyanobacterium]
MTVIEPTLLDTGKFTSTNRVQTYDPYWDEITKPEAVTVTVKIDDYELDDAWNSADFGEVLHQVDSNGQLLIFFETSNEPPDPDDYPTLTAFKKAWEQWEIKNPWWTNTRIKCKKSPSIKTAPEQNSSVLEQNCAVVETAINHVLEQNQDDTNSVNCAVVNSAPEQKISHWLEKYPVTRGSNQYWYYRYCWMEGRKIHHIHIPGGNINSTVARNRKQRVEEAIRAGESPADIKKILNSPLGL